MSAFPVTQHSSLVWQARLSKAGTWAKKTPRMGREAQAGVAQQRLGRACAVT